MDIELMDKVLGQLNLTPEDQEIMRRFIHDTHYAREITQKAINGEEIPAIIEKYCHESVGLLRKNKLKMSWPFKI